MRCTFCGNDIEPGTGTLYAKTDGKIIHFCSSKCEKNMLKLKRKPRTVAWTAEAQSLKRGTQ
ncbi:50S ribosomal protein L24e [Candidatus Woesearchaeota archaeon]|nr:50S ribosomal protein L24e [Candidatus Woesearchaeota archaeon]